MPLRTSTTIPLTGCPEFSRSLSRVITDSGFFYAMNAERSDEMAVFRIERTRDYTVMSNHHLRDKHAI